MIDFWWRDFKGLVVVFAWWFPGRCLVMHLRAGQQDSDSPPTVPSRLQGEVAGMSAGFSPGQPKVTGHQLWVMKLACNWWAVDQGLEFRYFDTWVWGFQSLGCPTTLTTTLLSVQKGFRGGSVYYGLGLPVGLSGRTWELNDLGLGYEEEGKGVNKDLGKKKVMGREKQKTKD